MRLRASHFVFCFVIAQVLAAAQWVCARQLVRSDSNSELSIGVNLHYGAQVVLTDPEGRKSGYDPKTGQASKGIPGTSFYEDSITDATDDSSDPATSDSKVLEIHPNAPQRYLVSVSPAGADAYSLEFLCGGKDHVSADEISIEPSEEHSFVLVASPGCADSFVSGAFKPEKGSGPPLLSYAYPRTSSVQLAAGMPFHVIVVYGEHITASSFTAALDGKTVANLFKPKENSIEAVSVPVSKGHHLIQLCITGKSEDGATLATLDSFTIDVQ